MRPYLAVITDSFRAALASRVLWILLILITCFLLAHAPIGVSEIQKADLQWRDLRDPVRFVDLLNEQRLSDKSSPGKHIASLLDNATKQQLRELVENDTSSDESDPSQDLILDFHGREIIEQVNVLLDRRDFFNGQAWEGIELPEEAKSLVDRGLANVSDKQLRYLNFVALTAAFDGEFVPFPPKSLQWSYAYTDILDPQRLTEVDGETQVAGLIAIYVDTFVDVLVGVFGLFVAVLVTAQIIPETYEKGSIELLLSKPVGRVLLFLAKFLGGCSFVLLNVGYLLVGLWLIAGMRLGVWENQLLICIPMFLFYFMIFYVVSALSGLIWRNAIVSVVLTMLFAGMCLGVGWTTSLLESFAIAPIRVKQIIATKEMTLSVTESQKVSRWDVADGTWTQVFSDNEMPNIDMAMLGPVYRTKGDQLLAIPYMSGLFADFANIDEFLVVASRDELHTRRPVAMAPDGAVGLFVDSNGDAVVVANGGIFRLGGELIKPLEQPVGDETVEVPYFQSVVTGGLPTWWLPMDAAMDLEHDRLFVWNSSHLAKFELNKDKQYQLKEEVELDDGERQAAVLAAAGSTVVVARADGTVCVFDSRTLELLQQHQPEGRNAPRYLHAGPDGKWFAIVFHNGDLWLYDAEAKKLFEPSIARQGDISAAAFASSDQLMVADRTTRISQYALDDMTLTQRLAPEMDTWELIYRYGTSPLYAVFPRPTELDNTVQYLLTGAETQKTTEADLKQFQQHYDPWAPVRSSLIFLVVMLFFCCVYCYRAEF